MTYKIIYINKVHGKIDVSMIRYDCRNQFYEILQKCMSFKKDIIVVLSKYIEEEFCKRQIQKE